MSTAPSLPALTTALRDDPREASCIVPPHEPTRVIGHDRGLGAATVPGLGRRRTRTQRTSAEAAAGREVAWSWTGPTTRRPRRPDCPTTGRTTPSGRRSGTGHLLLPPDRPCRPSCRCGPPPRSGCGPQSWWEETATAPRSRRSPPGGPPAAVGPPRPPGRGGAAPVHGEPSGAQGDLRAATGRGPAAQRRTATARRRGSHSGSTRGLPTGVERRRHHCAPSRADAASAL
jgi:hypothetical protein